MYVCMYQRSRYVGIDMVKNYSLYRRCSTGKGQKPATYKYMYIHICMQCVRACVCVCVCVRACVRVVCVCVVFAMIINILILHYMDVQTILPWCCSWLNSLHIGFNNPVLSAVSNTLTFKNPNEPLQGHLSLTHNQSQMM